MSEGEEVCKRGLFGAAGMALFGTVGSTLTDGHFFHRLDAFWITVFACSILMLSGAAVNFDPRRWLR